MSKRKSKRIVLDEHLLNQLGLDGLETLTRNAPICHPTLSSELLARIKNTFDVVGRYRCPNLEKWELGFMHDRNVEGQVAHWEKIGEAFRLYCDQNGQPSDDEKKKLSAATTAIAGGYNPASVASPVRRRLRECWKAVNGGQLKYKPLEIYISRKDSN